MDFGQAITSGFQGYVRFAGRSSRSEFWFWVLFVAIVTGVTAVLDVFLFPESQVGVIRLIWSLAVLLPGLAVFIRRLHDLDKSGWWVLLIFIPLIGVIILLVWACKKGTEGDNRFGANPLVGSPPLDLSRAGAGPP
jgi:uncharacterized membrane protein YhaH (DUF805 family)